MMKKVTEHKLTAYGVSTIVSAVAFGAIALVRHYLPLYCFFWTCFGAVVGACASRVALHIAYKDWSAEMWQVSIYQAVVAIGILGLIYSTSWGGASFAAALIVGMGIMAFGTRFLDQVGGTLKLYSIECETRYYPVGDEAGADDDTARPICLYDGKALTIKEAESVGLIGAADNARKKLAAIYGIVLEKEEK